MRLLHTAGMPLLLSCLIASAVFAGPSPDRPVQRFSTAGFYVLPGTGREVHDFNAGWRFLKADAPGAERPGFPDAGWEAVNLPHGLELLPASASGGVNYRGPAWYRKHFRLPDSLAGKRLQLHFEAVMGKCKVWLDGRLVAENFGGYLPFTVDLTAAGVAPGREHVLAVRADNSDDPTFLPGKPQDSLDYTYFGGIYRDVWLVSTGQVFITDPTIAGEVAGGGVFARTTSLSADGKQAAVEIDTHVANSLGAVRNLVISQALIDPRGKTAATGNASLSVGAVATGSAHQKLEVPNPQLWTPETPALYRLETRVLDGDSGQTLDGFSTRVGIRTVEFRGREGFFLNGSPFPGKLIGTNRHQDFAQMGNAMTNSLHWRDALKLREAGLRVIRGHYAQDPAFMDACDELGLFVIPSQIGWQFWNKDPAFEKRAIAALRSLVRRDRKHPSVLFWEPIINETHYPESYADQAREVVHAEYPVLGCAVACDADSARADTYDIIYSHPIRTRPPGAAPSVGWDGRPLTKGYDDFRQSIFTREWGDNVDDWNSQNSPSRVAREWGEIPMLVQAKHYAKPDYSFTCLDSLEQTPRQHIGGAFWHSFDHQRGYHNDPFLGGIMDAFRQPKTSYWMFQSQKDPSIQLPMGDSGPMLVIANELTPFSPSDVTVYTNCDEVRLSVFGDKPLVWKRDRSTSGIMHPPAVFKDAFDFMRLKALHRAGKSDQASLVAEGLIDGKVVAKATKYPAKRSFEIRLSADTCGQPLVADGSDLAVVIASVTDHEGNVRRLAREEVVFTVEGEGALVGDESIGANPRRVEWGTAPAIIRTTTTPGEIRVEARLRQGGTRGAKPGTILLRSVAPTLPAIPGEKEGDPPAKPGGLPTPASKPEKPTSAAGLPPV